MAADDDWNLDVTDLLPLDDSPRKLRGSARPQAAYTQAAVTIPPKDKADGTADRTAHGSGAGTSNAQQAVARPSSAADNSQPLSLRESKAPTQVASSSPAETSTVPTHSFLAKPSLFQYAAPASFRPDSAQPASGLPFLSLRALRSGGNTPRTPAGFDRPTEPTQADAPVLSTPRGPSHLPTQAQTSNAEMPPPAAAAHSRELPHTSVHVPANTQNPPLELSFMSQHHHTAHATQLPYSPAQPAGRLEQQSTPEQVQEAQRHDPHGQQQQQQQQQQQGGWGHKGQSLQPLHPDHNQYLPVATPPDNKQELEHIPARPALLPTQGTASSPVHTHTPPEHAHPRHKARGHAPEPHLHLRTASEGSAPQLIPTLAQPQQDTGPENTGEMLSHPVAADAGSRQNALTPVALHLQPETEQGQHGWDAHHQPQQHPHPAHRHAQPMLSQLPNGDAEPQGMRPSHSHSHLQEVQTARDVASGSDRSRIPASMQPRAAPSGEEHGQHAPAQALAAPSGEEHGQQAPAQADGVDGESRAAVAAWLGRQEAALARQQQQLQALQDSLSLRHEQLHSRERELQERDAAMAAHREVWDSERGTIVADLLRLAAKRQDAVHAQREDLDRRLAAARQLSSASPPIQASVAPTAGQAGSHHPQTHTANVASVAKPAGAISGPESPLRGLEDVPPNQQLLGSTQSYGNPTFDLPRRDDEAAAWHLEQHQQPLTLLRAPTRQRADVTLSAQHAASAVHALWQAASGFTAASRLHKFDSDQVPGLLQLLQELWHAAAVLNDLADGPGGLEALAAGLQLAAHHESAGVVSKTAFQLPEEIQDLGKGDKASSRKQRHVHLQDEPESTAPGMKTGKRSWLSRAFCKRQGKKGKKTMNPC